MASIVSRDSVSPEEALRSLLRDVQPAMPNEGEINEGSGVHKDSGLTQTLDEPIAQRHAARAARKGMSRIPGLPSQPITMEDAAIVDEAMAIVMAARRNRSEPVVGA